MNQAPIETAKHFVHLRAEKKNEEAKQLLAPDCKFESQKGNVEGADKIASSWIEADKKLPTDLKWSELEPIGENAFRREGTFKKFLMKIRLEQILHIENGHISKIQAKKL